MQAALNLGSLSTPHRDLDTPLSSPKLILVMQTEKEVNTIDFGCRFSQKPQVESDHTQVHHCCVGIYRIPSRTGLGEYSSWLQYWHLESIEEKFHRSCETTTPRHLTRRAKTSVKVKDISPPLICSTRTDVVSSAISELGPVEQTGLVVSK